jgi:hypothetical protein
MKYAQVLVTAILLLAISGCEMGPKSGRGFSLPEGDPEKGATTFVDLQCNACHVISGKPDIKQIASPEVTVVLGGQVQRIQTYGELLTSIVNPSHKLAKGYPDTMIADGERSKMINYNSAMTVEQLIDLVTFLQGAYEIKPYVPTHYQPYY